MVWGVISRPTNGTCLQLLPCDRMFESDTAKLKHFADIALWFQVSTSDNQAFNVGTKVDTPPDVVAHVARQGIAYWIVHVAH
jgi:hypothetical protein